MHIYTLAEIARKQSIDLGGGVFTSRVQGDMVVSSGVVSTINIPVHDLSSGAFTYTTSQADSFIVKSIDFKFSAPVTQTITLTTVRTDPNRNAAETQELTNNESIRFINGSTFINVIAGEQYKIQCTNSGAPAINLYVTLTIEV